MSKVVFVGNVPYNMTEEQLVGIFKSVGQVIGFRLVFDRDTAKPKGYGFCEFADHETALSAVRNLNNTDCGGRPLRIDLADSDPFLEGKTTVRGEILDGGYPGPSEPRSHWRGGSGRSHANDPEAFLANVPPGIKVPPGTTVLDSISRTLATMPPGQLMEVLAQMKAFVITHPDQARTLLVKHPQLSYALFQALLLNRIVDQNILERMLASSRGTAPVAPMQPPPQPAPVLGNRPPVPSLPPHLQQYPPQMPPFPPQGMQHSQQPMQPMGPMQMSSPPPGAMFSSHQPQLVPPVLPHGQQGYYDRPPMAQVPVQAPPPPVAQPQQQQTKVVIPPNVPEQQRAMIMQVLSMSQEQIDALAQNEKNAIMQLRSQFMGT